MIESAVIELLDKAWDRLAVRLIGVGVTGLSDARQLSLWDQPDERQERLYDAVRELRKRYGDTSIRPASDLGRKRPAG